MLETGEDGRKEIEERRKERIKDRHDVRKMNENDGNELERNLTIWEGEPVKRMRYEKGKRLEMRKTPDGGKVGK